MSFSSAPLVSVVTPVYNGGKYLAQCIESVLSQTYDDWEYIIVNNCSTDDSLAIASKYALADSRVSIYDNKAFLTAIANWNHAVRQVSPRSKYCKIVHADDWMFPECLSRMVELAEANPSVGIVTSYRLIGTKVGNDGLPYSRVVIPGREICRALLCGALNLCSNPSSTLFRSDYIRSRAYLYEESGDIHVGQDIQVCLELLKDADFGFVHQVLTFSREHEDSLTSKTANISTIYPEMCHLLKRYGPVYLTEAEYDTCWKDIMSAYSRFLGRSVVVSRGKEFWRYHRNEMRKLGCPLNSFDLATNALWETIRVVYDPVRHVWHKRCGNKAPRESQLLSPSSLLSYDVTDSRAKFLAAWPPQ